MRASSTVVSLKPMPGTADEWRARLSADDVTPADLAAFEDWIAVSPDNQAEYELSALTDGLARGLRDAPELRACLHPIEKSKSAKRSLLAAAAVVLICIASTLVWRSTHPVYATGIGEQKRVSLADGSTVQLNTASALDVDLQKDRRHIVLSRGEAFFDVVPDLKRPFVVDAGGREIRVLGTKFNIRMDRDAVSVVVLEGRVQVDGVDLLAGEGANIEASQPPVKRGAVNAEKATSWREGKIYFDREPVSKVIEEVNRYTQTPFVIADPQVRDLPLSGVFKTGDADSVAFALREVYDLKVERRHDRIDIAR